MDSKKLAFFLPNMFTALNMACGFLAITFSLNYEFKYACYVLMLGGIFDSVDGRVARMTGTSSSFGEQFDSMSDLISFGMAPGMIMYLKYLRDFDRLGIGLTFLFILCGALRLARFNANHDKISSNFFQGLPIPGAAMSLIGFVLLNLKFPALDRVFLVLSVPYVIFYSLLMVSNLPFNSFKDSDWVRKHKKAAFFILLVATIVLFSRTHLALGILMNFYVIASIIYYVSKRRQFKGIFQWNSGSQDE